VAELGQGAYFGDYAVTGMGLPTSDSISVFCATNCHFICLEKKHVDNAIKVHELHLL